MFHAALPAPAFRLAPILPLANVVVGLGSSIGSLFRYIYIYIYTHHHPCTLLFSRGYKKETFIDRVYRKAASNLPNIIFIYDILTVTMTCFFGIFNLRFGWWCCGSLCGLCHFLWEKQAREGVIQGFAVFWKLLLQNKNSAISMGGCSTNSVLKLLSMQFLPSQ